MFKVFGVILVVLAIAVAIVPMFTDCQSQGNTLALANGKTAPMKCHWTGVAELGMAIPLFGIGGMMIASRRKESIMYLGISGLIVAGVILAIPTSLIGVCSMPTHICVSTMKPALLSLGSIAGIVSVVGLVLSRRGKE